MAAAGYHEEVSLPVARHPCNRGVTIGPTEDRRNSADPLFDSNRACIDYDWHDSGHEADSSSEAGPMNSSPAS